MPRFARLSILLALAACSSLPAPVKVGGKLGRVDSWAIQLQGYEREDALDRLAYSPVDMLVVDAGADLATRPGRTLEQQVARLKRNKVVFAYLNVGQAEDYRDYWRPHWRKPTADERGDPSYLLTVDPEGWKGNYPVAYWDMRWQAVLWGTPSAQLDRIMAAGFDGVYLDWVLGYEDPKVVQAAAEVRLDAPLAMAELVRDLRAYARSKRPGFLVIAQNAAGLPDHVPEFIDWVDGVAQEGLNYYGLANAGWDDPEAGDLPTPREGDWSTETLARQLRRFLYAGKPVFTLDYCVDPDLAEKARTYSRARGFLPFVTRTPLDRLP